MGSHDHHSHSLRESADGGGVRTVMWALVANGILTVVQVVVGIVAGSLALLADSAHQVVDTAGLGVAAIAGVLAARGVSERNTFGWGRLDPFGGLLSALLLVGVSGWIIFEAIGRLRDPHGIDGAAVIVLAIVGMLVNGVSAVLLHGKAGSSLSMRAAVVHLVSDAIGSFGVLVAGVAAVFGVDWVDGAVAIALSLVIGWQALGLVRRAGALLVDATPPGIEPHAIVAAFTAEPGVVDVHHLHVWELAPDEPAMSAHVRIDGSPTLHDAQLVADRLRAIAHDQFGVTHTTFDLECHLCEAPVH